MRIFDIALSELTAEHQSCECRAHVLGEAWYEWETKVGPSDDEMRDAYNIGRPDRPTLISDLAKHLNERPDFEGEVWLSKELWSEGVPCYVALVIDSM